MSNEGFLRRWSRLKSHADGDAPEPAARTAPAADAGQGAARYSEGAGALLHRADDLRAIDLPPLAQTAPHPPVAPVQPGPADRLPTVADVAALGPDSDFSAFLSQGVDKAVHRMAMKKLFSDPHFSVLDGLDIYIDDYNKADPVPAAMLASLEHARSIFARPADDDTRQHDQPPGAEPDAARKPDDAPPPPDQDDA